MATINRRNQSVIAFKAGETIFHEGARGDKMFIILSGEVNLTKKVEDLEIPLQNLKQGAMFGEMALIDNQPRSATARAVSDVVCTVVSKLVFQHKLASEVPTWMQSMFTMLVQRMRMMIANSNSNTLGIPGHQIIDVLYLLLQQAEADAEGRRSLPWEGIVERIAYILGISKLQVSAILKMIVGSALANSHIDEKNSKVFVAKSLETFGQFDKFCKERFLVERRNKQPEDREKLRQQATELMGILGQIVGLDEGIHAIEIEEVSRRLGAVHKRSLDHYASAIRSLLNKRVLETSESKVGGLIYNVNFDLYNSGDPSDELEPVFSEIMKKISQLGNSDEAVETDLIQPLAAMAGSVSG